MENSTNNSNVIYTSSMLLPKAATKAALNKFTDKAIRASSQEVTNNLPDTD
jgi:hypothetical protein